MHRKIFSAIGCLQCLITVTACKAADNFALCPDLSVIGKGTKEYEEAARCVRVMAARYSVSGQNPNDIAVAAISFCKDYKFDALVEGLDPVAAEELLDRITLDFRDIAIRTTVEMRTGSCLQKPSLFDGINDPINRPSLKGK